MKSRLLSRLTVMTLALSTLFTFAVSAEAQKDENKDFTVPYPATLDNGKKVTVNATSCEVFFTEKPLLVSIQNSADSFADKSVEMNGADDIVYFSRGELSPGTPLLFKANVLKGNGPYITKVVFVSYNHKGRLQQVIELSKNSNKNAFAAVKGFTNDDYFDLSDKSNGVFTLINDFSGSANQDIEYVLEGLRIYTNLPEWDYTLMNFENMGNATPVYSIPYLVVGPGQTINIPVGQVGLPGQGYALAIADKTTVRDLFTGFESASGVLGLAADGSSVKPRDPFAVARSPLTYDFATQTVVGALTITNIGSGSIAGPFEVLLAHLTAGVTLVNASGTIYPDPYISLSGVSSLAPGQSVTVNLQFDDPDGTAITFDPSIFVGPVD